MEHKHVIYDGVAKPIINGLIHETFELEKVTKENLSKAIDYLKFNVDQMHFDMANYSNGNLTIYNPEIICGTVACALGHLPKCFGIDDSDFSNHSNYVFDYHSFCLRIFPDMFFTPILEWCFSGYWAKIDNTLEGAIKRMKYLLQHEAFPAQFFEILHNSSNIVYCDVNSVGFSSYEVSSTEAYKQLISTVEVN